MGSCCSVSSSKQVSAPKRLSKSKDAESITNTPQNPKADVKNSQKGSSTKKRSQSNDDTASKKKSQEAQTQGSVRKDKWKTNEKSGKENNENEDDGSIKIFKPLDLKYKRGQKVGTGTLGEVYHCLNLNTGELMAVKTIQFPGSEAKAQAYCRMLQREFCIINQIPLLNIVQYYYVDIVESNEKMSTIDIVFEYGSGGSIGSLLDRFRKLEERTAAVYIRQILETLCVLHECEIVHRDIKSSNILIDATGTIKLSDFGCCKWFAPPSDMPKDFLTDVMKTVVVPIKGSVYWQAPEVLGGISQGKPSDIWSIGCLLVEMLTGVPPWTQKTQVEKEVENLVLSGETPPLPRNISEACRDFFSQVFQTDPNQRPTAEELIDHPYIKGLNGGLTVTETQMDDQQGLYQGESALEIFETKKNLFETFGNHRNSRSILNEQAKLFSTLHQHLPGAQENSPLSKLHFPVGVLVSNILRMDVRNQRGSRIFRKANTVLVREQTDLEEETDTIARPRHERPRQGSYYLHQSLTRSAVEKPNASSGKTFDVNVLIPETKHANEKEDTSPYFKHSYSGQIAGNLFGLSDHGKSDLGFQREEGRSRLEEIILEISLGGSNDAERTGLKESENTRAQMLSDQERILERKRLEEQMMLDVQEEEGEESESEPSKRSHREEKYRKKDEIEAASSKKMSDQERILERKKLEEQMMLDLEEGDEEGSEPAHSKRSEIEEKKESAPKDLDQNHERPLYMHPAGSFPEKMSDQERIRERKKLEEQMMLDLVGTVTEQTVRATEHNPTQN